jgi:HK97 family phage major capsid protein
MAVIDRTGAAALIPEDASAEIIQGVPSDSAVLQLARRLPNMSRKQTRLPVLATLPTAYFVNGDTGLKQTSSVSWENVYLNAEELAVIVPIPEAVLDDNDYDANHRGIAHSRRGYGGVPRSLRCGARTRHRR